MSTAFTDGITTKEITLKEWTENGWSPEWQDDFYVVGESEQNNEGAYIVETLDDMIEQAKDMIHGRGDYESPSPDTVLFVDGEIVDSGDNY
jgi:hypothetical protein